MRSLLLDLLQSHGCEAHQTGASRLTYRRPDRFQTCQRGRGNKVTRLRPAQAIGGQGLSSLASGLIVATLIIVFLYVGREILEPLVIAVLLGFILAPLIRRLRNLGLWRVPSVILAVLFATAVIGALGSTIVIQVAQLADDLPKYETNLRAKIREFGGGGLTSSALERASGALKDLQSEISPPGAAASGQNPYSWRCINPTKFGNLLPAFPERRGREIAHWRL